MTKQIPKTNIQEVLSARKQIAIIWSLEDVQEVRPDLDDEQAWKVLQACKTNHDANDGISWVTIEASADYLYPSTV